MIKVDLKVSSLSDLIEVFYRKIRCYPVDLSNGIRKYLVPLKTVSLNEKLLAVSIALDHEESFTEILNELVILG